MNTWGVDELDTMDPAVLSWFLSEGRKRVNASRTIVSLMGHGADWSQNSTGSSHQHPASHPCHKTAFRLPRPSSHAGDETDKRLFSAPLTMGTRSTQPPTTVPIP